MSYIFKEWLIKDHSGFDPTKLIEKAKETFGDKYIREAFGYFITELRFIGTDLTMYPTYVNFLKKHGKEELFVPEEIEVFTKETYPTTQGKRERAGLFIRIHYELNIISEQRMKEEIEKLN